MSSKTQNVGHFVEYRLKRIVNSSSDGAVKASLANLRRGIGTTPGDIPELWELFLQDLPEEMLSRRKFLIVLANIVSTKLSTETPKLLMQSLN